MISIAFKTIKIIIMKKENFFITKYNAVNSPKVFRTVEIDEIFRAIKNGDENLSVIQEARASGKGSTQYDSIKTLLLPTFRFNFLFNGSACNKNITGPTGLIYIDVDNCTTIPESEYVYAKWKSLSNTGLGVVVKVDNLTKTNYKEVYNQVSELIGVSADSGARKATQQTVLSYDADLFHNSDSSVYHCIEKEEKSSKQVIKIDPYTSSSTSLSNENVIAYDYKEKVPSLDIKEGEKDIQGNETFCVLSSSGSIRFNNINDYFTDYTPYIMYEEKIKICSPYIPFNIEEGCRHSSMFTYLSQITALNPTIEKHVLQEIGTTMNKKMPSKLPMEEVYSIINSVLKMREDGAITMYFNRERRFLFNPNLKFAKGVIMNIVNVESGKIKTLKRQTAIYNILEVWDFATYGKITQEKVSDILNCHLTTIKRHWSVFKDYVSDLNASRSL